MIINKHALWKSVKMMKIFVVHTVQWELCHCVTRTTLYYYTFKPYLRVRAIVHCIATLLSRTYMYVAEVHVVSDARHGFDTCKLEATKSALNNLGTPKK